MEVIKCSICQAVVSDPDKPCWSCGGDSKNIKKTTDFTDVNSSFTENVLTSIGVILIIVGIISSIVLISKYRLSFLEVIYVLIIGTVTGFLLIGFAQILYYLRTIKDILKAKNNE